MRMRQDVEKVLDSFKKARFSDREFIAYLIIEFGHYVNDMEQTLKDFRNGIYDDLLDENEFQCKVNFFKRMISILFIHLNTKFLIILLYLTAFITLLSDGTIVIIFMAFIDNIAFILSAICPGFDLVSEPCRQNFWGRRG